MCLEGDAHGEQSSAEQSLHPLLLFFALHPHLPFASIPCLLLLLLLLCSRPPTLPYVQTNERTYERFTPETKCNAQTEKETD